jgi:hypothetical protein
VRGCVERRPRRTCGSDTKNYIKTDIDGCGPGFPNCPEKTKVKVKKKGARGPPQKSCGFVNR